MDLTTKEGRKEIYWELYSILEAASLRLHEEVYLCNILNNNLGLPCVNEFPELLLQKPAQHPSLNAWHYIVNGEEPSCDSITFIRCRQKSLLKAIELCN